MNKKNIEKEAPKYTSRLIVRLTPQLHKEIAEYAALCGLTTSAYARKRLEGKYPKQRLTDKEMNGWVKTLLWIFLPCFLYTVISIVYFVASYIDK